MADGGAAAPGVPPAASAVQSRELLRTLRERQRPAGQLFDLPVPPALPPAASEEALRARGEEMRRLLAPVKAVCGDSFLRAAARELRVDEDAYCAAQRAAVVGALDLCTPDAVARALASVGWARGCHAWQAAMRLRTTPFDALALMLWSLLNAKIVLVLGGDEAHDEEFCACTELMESVTVGQLDASRWVGFDAFTRVTLAPLQQQAAKRARDGSLDAAPPAQRPRRQEEHDGGGALPVPARDPARDALQAECALLEERVRELKEQLRDSAGPSCFYLVRHPMDAFVARGYLGQLRRKPRALIEAHDWVVVGFGRTRYVFQGYANGRGRLDEEYFAARVAHEVYAFQRADVLVWQESAADALHSASLERLLKAVLAFTQRDHAPARELRELLRGSRAVCAFSHPACCTVKLGGWVDETLLMHPQLWQALHARSAAHADLNGGRLLGCDAHALQAALLPEAARQRHAALNAVWAQAQP
jgi:hypothetical protein